MRELTRRDVLAGTTALGAVALGGCVAGDSDGEGDDGSENSDNGNSEPESEDTSGNRSENETETGTDDADPDSTDSDDDTDEETVELVETLFTSGAVEQSPNDRASATVTGGNVVVEGAVPVSTPCHEAVLSDATLDGGQLSLAVDAEDTSDDQSCTQVISSVEYEATLEFSQVLADLSQFSSVTVEHGGRSNTVHTVSGTGVSAEDGGGGAAGGDSEDDAGARATVLGHSVTTVETNCTSGAGDGREVIRDPEFSRGDGTVTVSGSVTASTPCHEAYIERVDYDDGRLSLVVGAENTLEEGQYCTQCIAAVQYEATVEVAAAAAVEDVSVTHLGLDAGPSTSSP